MPLFLLKENAVIAVTSLFYMLFSRAASALLHNESGGARLKYRCGVAKITSSWRHKLALISIVENHAHMW